MINSNMKLYDFYLFGEKNEYGQETLNEEVAGTIKMSIYETSMGVIDDVRYKDANYIGLTTATLDDSYVIQYGEEKLKVLYVYPKGRFKQVFLKAL